MYSPVPNAYFAKYVTKDTQQDSSQNTASQPVTSVKEEAPPSAECTDEELMSASSQAEELAETTANTSHSDADRISEDSQTTSNLLSDAHCATENRDVIPPGEVQTILGSSVSGEGITLIDEEMNIELPTSQIVSGERAEESNETSASDETPHGPSHSNGQDSFSASSTDHGNTTWISCMVGKMIDL